MVIPHLEKKSRREETNEIENEGSGISMQSAVKMKFFFHTASFE
jgi:hypothetical protein